MANIALNKPSGGQLILSPEDGTSTETVTIPSVGVGKVLNVWQTTKNDGFQTTSGSWVTVSGFSLSVTPSSSSNKILLTVMSPFNNYSSSSHMRVVCNGTPLLVGVPVGSRMGVNASTQEYNQESNQKASVFNYLHSPASTSAQVYEVQVYTTGGTTSVNMTTYDADNVYYGRSASTMVAMEVAA